MKSLFIRRLLYCMIGVAGGLATAGNPLGFREYDQIVTLHFATPAEAEAAELKILPLPHPYKMAFSSRWDDSTQNHLKTLEVMQANGIKGTFYLCNAREFSAETCRKVLEAGSSLGLHTAGHPILPTLNPNRQFEEYMSNKIDIETVSQRPVNTQVFPFCQYTSPKSYTKADLGKILRTCGVIGGATVYYGALEKDLDYPAGTLAASRVVAPGDNNPDVAKAEREIGWAENNAEALAAQPSISIGIHSWHTPEGLKALDRVFKLRARHPDYWYCNQSDYSAYRYEANQVKISKKTDGSKAIFTIRRIDPAELGADVPLSLELTGAKSPDLAFAVFSQPHDSDRRIPECIDRAAADGKSTRFPGLSAKLAWENHQWQLTFDGADAAAVSNVAVTFRGAPGWTNPVDRQDRAAASDPLWIADFGTFSPEVRYAYGRAYGSAQIDFTLAGKRCRLYAECKAPPAAPDALPLLLNDVVHLYLNVPENLDWSSLSSVGNDPAAMGLKAVKRWPNGSVNEGAISVNSDETQALKSKIPAAVVWEFRAADATPFEIGTNAAAFYCNGEKIELTKGRAVVKPVPGRNRIALSCNVARWPNGLWFYCNVNENPAVDVTPELTGVGK